MSNAFTNFLGGVVSGIFNKPADLKDFQHADRVFVRDNYARAPKVGFLFFIDFEIEPSAILDPVWKQNGVRNIGVLVKSVDLPKFAIKTETMNQYNRKTVVQSKIDYSPATITFHDDNSDWTNNLWVNYFKYYYRDSRYSDSNATTPVQFGDTKFSIKDNAYGLDSYQTTPFFKSISIYVLHQQKFTEIKLVNPIIKEWAHDTLVNDESSKILSNKMVVEFETVLYSYGSIGKDGKGTGFKAYYDRGPSPLSISGGGTSSITGPGGLIAGAAELFGTGAGSISSAITSGNPLDLLGAAIRGNSLLQNARQMTKAGVVEEGYSIIGGVLKNIQATGNQPGGVGNAIQTGLEKSGLGVLGTVGVNLFSNKNSSVNGETKATPSNLSNRENRL